MRNKNYVYLVLLLLGIQLLSCDKTEPIIKATSIRLNENSKKMYEGSTDMLTATITPDNATFKGVKWESTNKEVADVDSEGNITATSKGYTRIIASGEKDNISVICNIEVIPNWIKLSNNSLDFYKEDGSSNITLTTSTSWSIVSKPDWLTITPMSGTNSEETISISLNTSSNVPTIATAEIIFKLDNHEQNASLNINRYLSNYYDGEVYKAQSATIGNGVNIILMGDGYTASEMAQGKYTTDIDKAVEHFFDIEPYRTYRDYFNIYYVYVISEESGISDHRTTKKSALSAKYVEPSPSTLMSIDGEKCFAYASKTPGYKNNDVTVIVVANSTRYGGTAVLYNNSAAIAIAPLSKENYPYDFRGLVQHEAGGHAFGKLADEYFSGNETISEEKKKDVKIWQEYNHFNNIDLTNNTSEISWKYFFDEINYSYVGIHEGGYYHRYGVWRSEPSSLMINNIPYINAVGREAIVRRIKRLASETFSFAEFKQRDVRETQALTRSAGLTINENLQLPPPRLVEVK